MLPIYTLYIDVPFLLLTSYHARIEPFCSADTSQAVSFAPDVLDTNVTFSIFILRNAVFPKKGLPAPVSVLVLINIFPSVKAIVDVPSSCVSFASAFCDASGSVATMYLTA